MAEKIITAIVEGGKATAGPPIGPALGPLGINAGAVVAEINKQTAAFAGTKVPVKIIADPKTKSFKIEVGSPPVSELLKKEAKIEKGSGTAGKEAKGNITLESAVKVAKSVRGKNLSKSLKDSVKEVLGSCMSMGITVEGRNAKEIVKEISEGKHDSLMK
ncbi:MAG: 50S ribosomal protein L11 [Candidatus Anstonellales archaeon]